MGYKIHLIGKKAVKIIERFENSILVEYIKTGVQSSVNPSAVKTITVNNERNKNNNSKSKNNGYKRNGGNSQTKFDFPG